MIAGRPSLSNGLTEIASRVYRPVTPPRGIHLGFEDDDGAVASIGDTQTWTLPGRMTRELIDEVESAREAVAGK
jgi:hypothetical protein